jgi:branched-chain amino acid transport system substrate-binding protein
MKKYALPLLLIILAGILPVRFLLGYFSSYQYSLHKREELARMDTGDINIAITWNLSFMGTNFKRGADLALEEENKRGFTFTKDNVSIQKKMVLHEFHDDKINNNHIIEEVTGNKSIVAALTISETTEAIASSVSYEQHGIVLISAFATDQHLTNHNFKYTFSILPTSRQYSQALVNFCELKGYKNIASLYSRQGIGGLNLAINFTGLLNDKDIKVVFSHALDENQQDYRHLIYDLQQHSFDAILLGAKGEIAGRIIHQLRTMGVNNPLFSGISMDDTDLWELSDKQSNNVFVASIYDDTQESENSKSDAYIKYYNKYGYPPNFYAGQGYDALKILAAAIRKSNSIVPIDVAGTLTYNLKNEFGNNYFNNSGLIVDKTMFIKEMRNGKFYNALKPE